MYGDDIFYIRVNHAAVIANFGAEPHHMRLIKAPSTFSKKEKQLERIIVISLNFQFYKKKSTVENLFFKTIRQNMAVLGCYPQQSKRLAVWSIQLQPS